MCDVCAGFGAGAELREFNGVHDHVHRLVHHPPKVALSRCVGSLKGASARRLRQEFPGRVRT
ncbi:IS200/IS605 family transposase [Streptomyces sp. NPDC005122]